MPRIVLGRTPLCQSVADSADITNTKAWNASTKTAPGNLSWNGRAPPPSYPKTSIVPVRVAPSTARTTAFNAATASLITGTFGAKVAKPNWITNPATTSRQLHRNCASLAIQAREKRKTNPRIG